jgi:superoxide dismutase, Fe-Mn family
MTAASLERREFIARTTKGAASAVVASIAGTAAGILPVDARAASSAAVPAYLGASPQEQPPLPYAENALEPVISARTIGIHYGKHHRAYFENLSKLVPGTPFAGQTLETIIVKTYGDTQHEDIFNNAGQAWNHNFYWNSMSPTPTEPSATLQAAIMRDFGSLDTLHEQLVKVSASQFGSGWGWLVIENGKLSVMKTSNANVPFTSGKAPLLTVDVWEHAYYLDYQNRRPDYLKGLTAKLINWKFASANYEKVA